MAEIANAAAAAVSYIMQAGAAVSAGTPTFAQIATTVAVRVASAVASAAAADAAGKALAGKERTEGSATSFRLDTDAGIPFAFGRVGVGGTLAYRKSYGATNRYQSMVSTLSAAGPIKAYVSFSADREATTFSSEVSTTGEHVGAMWLQTKLGTQPQTALTSPAGLEGSVVAPSWDADNMMSGRAAVMWTLSENSKLSEYKGGVPLPRHIIEGKFGWDPREDSTWPGGVGACRLNDPATWVWIEEGCIAALNWAIGMWEGDSGGGKYGVPYACSLVGGIGSTLDGIDVDSLVNGANVADANGWTLAAYPTTKDDKYVVLTQMLSASGCVPSRTAGRIGCVSLADEASSVLTVTARDTAGPVEVSLGQSRMERRNTALPKHWSEAHDWQMVQLGPVTNAAWVTEDREIVRTRPADYPFVPNAIQAAQLAYYELAHDREPISGAVPFKPHMRQIKAGDCFTFSEPGFLLNGLKVRCIKRAWDPMRGVVKITFRQETDAKHAAALAQIAVIPPSSVLATPPPAFSSPPTNFSATATDAVVTALWRNPTSELFDHATLFRAAGSILFGAAVAVGTGLNPALGGFDSLSDTLPGFGDYAYWIVAYDPDGIASAPVGPVLVNYSDTLLAESGGGILAESGAFMVME